MALFATHLGMCAFQFEGRKVVIKGCITPTLRRMASRTIRAKRALVLILVFMAGITILGRTFEYIIDMAFFTFYFCMFPFQFESGKVVVESCILPIRWLMASRTIRAKSTLMFIIFLMTRGTILGCRLKICDGACIKMAFCTSYSSMLAIQLKGKTRVGEITAKSIHAIVAGETSRPVSKNVRLRKSNVHLTVATVASIHCEFCYILLMTIFTTERLFLNG